MLAMSLTLTTLNACGVASQPSGSQASQPSPLAVPSSTPTPLDPADVTRWIQFRQAYGLRSDRAWVLQVASDPVNTNEIDVPLTPAELSLVSSLNLSAQLLAPELKKFGELFSAEYAGVMIENTRVVIQFSGQLEAHRAAIETLFGSDAPIDVRNATYSLQQLDKFAQEVEADRGWFPSVGAELFKSDSYELTNSVRVRYIARDKAVEPLIRAHFGDPAWITVKWYGPPEWTGPRGNLRVSVVDRASHPVEVECLPESLDMAVASNYLPLESGPDGKCEFDKLASVTWRVGIAYENRDGERANGTQTVRVPNDGTASLRFVVDR